MYSIWSATKCDCHQCKTVFTAAVCIQLYVIHTGTVHHVHGHLTGLPVLPTDAPYQDGAASQALYLKVERHTTCWPATSGHNKAAGAAASRPSRLEADGLLTGVPSKYLERWRQRHADADHYLQAFPHRQVWSYDIVRPHEEDVAHIPAHGRDAILCYRHMGAVTSRLHGSRQVPGRAACKWLQKSDRTHGWWAHRRCTTSCRPWASAGHKIRLCVGLICNQGGFAS